MKALTQKILMLNGLNKNMLKLNNKGLTLLEVLITLAILGIIAVSFISIFSITNINISFSGKKANATVEAKSILDEIHSKAIIDIGNIKNIIVNVLNDKGYTRDDYEIFNIDDIDNDHNFYKYNNKKIHCLINKESIEIWSIKNFKNAIKSNLYKIKILLYYDNGKKNVELSTYIPIKED